MDSALRRIPTNDSDADGKNDGLSLSAVISESSTTSVSKFPPPAKFTGRTGSTHSLLAAASAGTDIRRQAYAETNHVSIGRANLSMPYSNSNPSVERRLSASFHLRSPRISEDMARSPPSSVKSFEDRQLATSPPLPTTATDTTSITTSVGVPTTQGPPVLTPSSPPKPFPNIMDGVSDLSSQVALANQNLKSDPLPGRDTASAGPTLEVPGKTDASSEGAIPSRTLRPAKPRSVSSSRRFSGATPKSDDGEPESRPFIGKIGVCALDVKARSRPSRQILTRLQGNNEFEVIVFGDKVILDEEVENWPICDFLISFFSEGFPLDKAIAYAKMRKPFLVNDLMMQKVLWDRRLCLRILDSMKVPTPDRIEVNRDGGPVLESADLAQHMKRMCGVSLPGPEDGTGGGVSLTKEAFMADENTLVVDGKTFKKPFVEKPVSGEDHNVIIYFPTSYEGGGARRLFRKIGNKSSEFDPDLIVPRCVTEPNESFIYEQFVTVENAEDVKAYTVGADYCHAETRKSPVVDGLVRRNTHGKELRYVTKLTTEEKQMAAKVAQGFGQRICGFDLLRTGTSSYVIDVNGWSFVKDNESYYNDCANILRGIFYSHKFQTENITDDPPQTETATEPAPRRSTKTSSHRQVFRTILKSPSMSKLSQHIQHPRHHGSGAASPKIGPPMSSPPSMERPSQIMPGTLPPVNNATETLPPALSSPDLISTAATLTDQGAPTSNPEANLSLPAIPPPSSKHSWKLKGVVTVIRHADRTPKQKIKFTAHSQVFVDLLKGHHEEVLLKGPAALASVEAAVKTAIAEKLEDPTKLRNLRNALARKGNQPDTKVQIKPMFRKRKAEETQVLQAMPKVSEAETETSDGLQKVVSDAVAASPGRDVQRIQTRSDSISGVTFSRFAAAENDLVLDKLQLVMKWGGEPTHSARYQSQDLGTNMRDDYQLMNREVLSDVRFFTSSEKRVRTSAQIFAAAFLDRQDLPDDSISVRKDLLDDSNAAKDVMDKVKKKLKHLLREGNYVPEEFAWPKDVPEPYTVMLTVVELLKFHRQVMRQNFKRLSGAAVNSLAAIGNPSESKDDKNVDINSIQARWCTGEDAELFKERWEKLFAEFCDSEKADPSKISELYDTMKYDALHNKQFLEWVFTPSEEMEKEDGTGSGPTSPPLENGPKQSAEEIVPGVDRSDTMGSANGSHSDRHHSFAQKIGLRRRSVLTRPPLTPPLTGYEQDASYFKLFSGSGDSRSKSDKRLGRLRELYRYAKILFDYIGPQEYGITNDEKLEIGLLTSLPLLREIVQDLEELQASDDAKSFVYFTKESHVYTLLNCIMEGGIHTKIKRATIPELDYLSQICFELYEAKDSETEESTYSIRISISPGCHTIDPLDVSLDSKHAIGSAPRRTLTNHQDWKEVISTLKAKFNTVQLPKSFLAVNVSDKHEQEAEAKEKDRVAEEQRGRSGSKGEQGGENDMQPVEINGAVDMMHEEPESNL